MGKINVGKGTNGKIALPGSSLRRCRKLEGGPSAKWTPVNNYGEGAMP